MALGRAAEHEPRAPGGAAESQGRALVKVLIEALAAEYGGIRTYVENLLGAWARVGEDEVHLLLAAGSTLAVPAEITRHEVVISRPVQLGRPWAQTAQLRRLVARTRPDVVLATLPSTTVLDPGAPMAVVVYDLRHDLRPEQFSSAQRLLRRVSYGRGYQLADLFIAISRRSLDDLQRVHPGTATKPGGVVHLGADHVLSWQRGSTGPAIAFGHHTNKNPRLVLDAWALAVTRGVDLPELAILGLGGSHRAAFEQLVAAHGLSQRVRVAPFLEEQQFQAVFGAAPLVVFPSDFEGFGLPVVEAMALGIPVVIGPEPATREVGGGHAFEADDWTPESLADAIGRAVSASPAALAAARDHATSMTWERTVAETRAALMTLTDRVHEQR